MITRPVRERSIETIGDMVENGIRKSGFEEVGLLSLSSADHTEIGEVAKGLADRYEGTNVSLSLPSPGSTPSTSPWPTSSPATAAAPGLTFAPEGGSERMRKVINKMVTEEDLIRTVAAAYSHGWRQVKLYFMCGLPDRDRRGRPRDRRPGQEGDRQGPRGLRPQRHPLHGLDRRVRAQAAHAVPVGRAARPRDHRRAAAQAARRRSAPTSSYGRAIGFRYHDGKPGIIEGLLSRGDRRVGARHRGGLARRRPVRRLERALLLRPLGRRAASRRWPAPASTSTGTPPASATTTRCCPGTTSTPASTRTGSGPTGRTPSTRRLDVEVEDCRWTPCYDCGVCPEMGTEIQIGPTGQRLLPLSVV